MSNEIINDFYHNIELGNVHNIRETIKKYSNIIHAQKIFGSYYKNPLTYAVDQNKTKICELLLKAGSKIIGYANTPDTHRAAINGNYEIFMLLLDFGADPFIYDKLVVQKKEVQSHGSCGCGACKSEPKTYNFTENIKNPILHRAVYGKNLLIIDKIISMGCEINNEDEYGETALHVACEYQSYDIFKYLVQHGADINHVTKMQKPLINIGGKVFKHGLLLKAMSLKSINIIKYLLEMGIKLDDPLISHYDYEYNSHDEYLKCLDVIILLRSHMDNKIKKFNELHVLAYNGDLNCIINTNIKIENLLEVHRNFKTPIHVAIVKNHILIVQHLIEKFQIKVTDDMFEEAVNTGSISILNYLLSNTKPNLSKYLKIAAKNDNFEMLEFLIEHGADIHYDNDKALRNAWRKINFSKCGKLLLEKGANANAEYYSQKTLLFDYYGECSNNFIHDVKMLIDYGADINKKDQGGENIIDTLIIDLSYLTKNRFEMLILLLSYDRAEFNLGKLKDKVIDLKKKDIKIYDIKIRCPGDEMNFEWARNIKLYLPIIEQLIKDKEECSICMEYHANHVIEKCMHRVICSNCYPKIDKCPRCQVSLK